MAGCCPLQYFGFLITLNDGRLWYGHEWVENLLCLIAAVQTEGSLSCYYNSQPFKADLIDWCSVITHVVMAKSHIYEKNVHAASVPSPFFSAIYSLRECSTSRWESVHAFFFFFNVCRSLQYTCLCLICSLVSYNFQVFRDRFKWKWIFAHSFDPPNILFKCARMHQKKHAHSLISSTSISESSSSRTADE